MAGHTFFEWSKRVKQDRKGAEKTATTEPKAKVKHQHVKSDLVALKSEFMKGAFAGLPATERDLPHKDTQIGM